MAAGKKIDIELLTLYARRHREAQGRTDRAKVVKEFADLTGMSQATAYRHISKVKTGDMRSILANRKARRSRKNEIEMRLIQEGCDLLCSLKMVPGEKAAYWRSTDEAIRIGLSMGYSYLSLMTRSSWDRWMRKLGLDRKSWQSRPAARKLMARYPGHVFAVDATPMNQYFMDLGGGIKRFEAIPGDKHLDDLLRRDGLQKIWVYYLVDMHTGAYLARPYASRGENAEDWLDFLRWCFMEKGHEELLDNYPDPLKDCPVEGAPTILFCDRGSGIGRSSLVGRMIGRLGGRVVTHVPGNPSAKGLVEGRCGAFKRSHEVGLTRNIIQSMDQLRFFYAAWAAQDNREKGCYDKWQIGMRDRTLRKVTKEAWANSLTSHIQRTITQWGTVRIDSEEWFVTEDEKYIGQKVDVYSPPAGDGTPQYVAEMPDGVILSCEPLANRERDFERPGAPVKTEGSENRKRVREIRNSIQGQVQFEHLLPEGMGKNVIRFPGKSEAIQVDSQVPPDSFLSAEDAWRWLLNRCKIEKDDLDPEHQELIDAFCRNALASSDRIPSRAVVEFANLINRTLSEEETGEHNANQ